MSYFPFGFRPIEPSTWAYLSSLLMLALFFKFNRFWSFRNFDLWLLILLAPGLLMVHYGKDLEQRANQVNERAAQLVLEKQPGVTAEIASDEEPGDELGSDPELSDEETTVALSRNQQLERFGFIWIFAIGLIWLIRLFYDPYLKRKPVLDPNLSIGGLVFLGCSLMIFLFINILTSRPADLSGPRGAAQLLRRSASSEGDELKRYGPGLPLLFVLPTIPTLADKDRMDALNAMADGSRPADDEGIEFLEIARVMAILSQIAIVAGLIVIGRNHFGSFSTGIGMATIFLMLPYTHQFAGASMHLLPGALLVWAVATFRRPLVAGVFIGMAAGVCYYPFFLLPLWISFYWERGRMRFTIGALMSIVVIVSSLAFTSVDFGGFVEQLKSIFGFWWPRTTDLQGIWALNWEPWFRLPLLVGFIVLCVSYAFWPVTKNLATLVSCSAAAMIAVQYWHGDGGGLFMAWFLPLLLLVIFRPNLDDQVAVSVLTERKKASPSEGAATAATA